jgi:hypothetical protein
MSGVIGSGSPPSHREGLAGVSAADEINLVNAAPIDGFDVAEVRDLRPVVGEDAGGVRVDLALPGARPAGPLEAEVDAADTGEQRAEGGFHRPFPSTSSP